MRRLKMLLTVTLVLASCSGAATETTTTTTTTTTTSTTSTTTTTLLAESTTTMAPVDPMAMIAAGIAGTYTGEWRNTTFGSSGPISASLEVTPDGEMAVSLDVGGFVFGETDPDAEEFSFTLTDVSAGASMETATFGVLTFSITPLGIMVEAPDVPSPSIASFQVVASPGETGFVGTYVIEFEGGGSAEGEFDMAQATG